MTMVGNLDRLVVIVSSLVIALFLASIAAMGVAAWSFSQAVTVELPLVATFDGYVEQRGSHANAVGIVARSGGPLTAPPATIAIAYRGRPEGI